MLITADGYIKLIDYGVAKIGHKFGESATTCSGTEGYMSPEMFKADKDDENSFKHSFGTDWWSVGILTFELMMGERPFTTDN
jgi:serine/threonine protein kinase